MDGAVIAYMTVGKNWVSLVILSVSLVNGSGRDSLLEELDKEVSSSLQWPVRLPEEADDDGGEEDELDGDIARELSVSQVGQTSKRLTHV